MSACSFQPSSKPEPERIASTSQALAVTPSITAGYGHTCELFSDATVRCWGDNAYGELGLGTYGGSYQSPTTVPGLSGVQAISGSYAATCALMSDQTVECWGYGYTSSPRVVTDSNGAALTGAVSISAGGAFTHGCAVLTTGNVSCWGDNTFGELGNGTTGADGTMNPAGPVLTSTGVPLSNVKAVVADGYGTCALLGDNTVQCWGLSVFGELGIGTPTGLPLCGGLYGTFGWTCATVPAGSVSGLNNAVEIAAGDGESVCARLLDGTVQCWGDNEFGQLGDGTTTDRWSPVAVTGLNAGASAIALGPDHSCALLSDGTVQCWGNNTKGELGNGTTTSLGIPVNVIGVSGASSISAGRAHSCALLSSGGVMCWGEDIYGQLGDGTFVSSPLAQGPSPAPNPPIEIAAGWGHTCLRLPNGTVQCWGDNAYGELGLGTYTGPLTIPITVPGLSRVEAISGGYAATCALMFDQTVKCWGYGYGATPTAVVDSTGAVLTGAVSISASNGPLSFGCAVLTTGTVSCWGDNTFGQLGNGTTGVYGTTYPAVAVSGLSGVIAVATHGYGTCALQYNGTVQCWGDGSSGELGIGPTTGLAPCGPPYGGYGYICSNVPAGPVSGLSSVVGITGGGNASHVCALQSNGHVSCWGFNSTGQLGDGTTTSSPTPLAVTLNGPATEIEAGASHSCAVLLNGTVECWGGNANGQLGDPSATTPSGPVPVVGVSGAFAVTAGERHSCALLTGTTNVACWGDDTYSQLGDGGTTNSTTAVGVGGYSPDVIPAVYGIATDSAGVTKAIFTYATGATSVQILYGLGNNALLDANNAFIPSPLEMPPQTFVSAPHAPFVATLGGAALTWQVDGHSATATTSSTQLPTVSNGDGTKDAVLPDGTKVNLDSAPPQDPGATPDPPHGATDDGVLTGTLQVSPSGAATYTLPISMPPGVAGMAPNLSLVYNSQAPDGIAGQGWSLQGLSVITKCPRTQQQDGVARPIMMDADPSPPFNTTTDGGAATNPINNTDGICLDGQRLFEQNNSATYMPEKQDFSTITYVALDNHFDVQTKAGEIRSYGLTSGARLTGSGLDMNNNQTTATAVWALERVTDVWGNFFSFQYSQIDENSNQTALRVTEIDYTGHSNANGVADMPTFAKVKFDYNPPPPQPQFRTDVRWARFGQSKFPTNKLLQTITTYLGTTVSGTYTLGYNSTAAGQISMLQSIEYCTGASTCNTTRFGWDSNDTPAWKPAVAGYTLPADIPTGHGLLGAQFLDVDGDGLTDLVYAGPNFNASKITNELWINTGTQWPSVPQQQGLPAPLVDLSYNPTGARFADMDGDGVLDFIVDQANPLPPGATCTAFFQCPGVWLNRFAQHQGWVPAPEFSTLPSTSSFANFGSINFNSQAFCGQFPSASDCDGYPQVVLGPASLVDINGDGKMDIVRVEEEGQLTGGSPPGTVQAVMLEVLVNQGAGSSPAWVEFREPVLGDSLPPSCSLGTSTAPCLDPGPAATAGDVNRDGFSDLMREGYYAPSTVIANEPNPLFEFQQTALNKIGPSASAAPTFGTTRTLLNNCSLSTNGACGGGAPFLLGPQVADVDGDGLYDDVLFGPFNIPIDSSNLAFGVGVALNNGAGPRLTQTPTPYTAGYVGELSSLAPNLMEGQVFTEDFVYALADINGDGLPDLIRNHVNCPDANACTGVNANALNLGGGEIQYNTGTTWGSGSDPWHRIAGPSALPGVVPSPITGACGSAFVDLNGDGLVDFVEEAGCEGSPVDASAAYLNRSRPPVINAFPNGRAVKTLVSYVHITEAKARTHYTAPDGIEADAVYSDDGLFEPGTKAVAPPPLRVVSTVQKADGSGTGTFADTTYAYQSLRADPTGRGPLGFKHVVVYDHAADVKTDTQYMQAYPYTGLPTVVERFQVTQGNAPLTTTTTNYCDSTNVRSDGTPICSPAGIKYAAPTSLFVYPYLVVDAAWLDHATNGSEQTTTSSYRYDTFGNSTQVAVTTTATTVVAGTVVNTSNVTSTTNNYYVGSQEQQQGKVTDVQVTASGDASFGLARSHHTSFAYKPVSNFSGASSTALALTLKSVEPDSVYPLREDTAFAYDQFGNVVTTTACADDFGSCVAGATSPSNLPYRTTTTSYNPSSFNSPTGPALISSLPYLTGRFPVKITTITTNEPTGGTTEHDEYRAYDPVKGVLLQKTDENGIHTCYLYDDLGRPTSEAARCGSDSPIVKTTSYFSPASGSPTNSQLVTVTRPPSGTATWTFTDDQGKVAGAFARSFGGGFVGKLATYNALGQVLTETKPFLIQNFGEAPPTACQNSTCQTATHYDFFNRVDKVTEDLGAIAGSNTAKQLVTTTSYSGFSLTTGQTANGGTQNRTETKNALGKLKSVVDSNGTEIDYQYDVDGNLLVASSQGSNLVVTSYDTRGRKWQTTDADLGTWNYTFDGFGELVSQTDANNQRFDMTYDELGRMLTKQNIDPSTGVARSGETAQWIYDTTAGAGIGKLAAMVSEEDTNFNGPCALPVGAGAAVSTGRRAVKTYTYSGFGDLQSVAECADGDTFQTSYEYDGIGRQSRIHYPAVNNQQLAVSYHYTILGYLQYLLDDSVDNGVLWQAKAMDAFGNVTDEQTRSGVETQQNRSLGNGWLSASSSIARSDGNTKIQDWTYTFDELGNLLSRQRQDPVADAPYTETFLYDALNRVTSTTMTVGTPINKTSSSTYGYDPNGNLTLKDGNNYTYGTCAGGGRSGSGLHQVCSINSGPTFVYDAAGNLTSSNGQNFITYNAHNKAVAIQNAAGMAQFMYGADDNRVVQLATSGSTTARTVYVGLGGTGKSMYERTTTVTSGTTTVEHTNFIYAGGAHGGNAFAVRTMDNTGATTATRYLTFDHLGSTTSVSDEKGHIATATGTDTQLLGYDPWGARRNPDGQPATSSSFSSSVGNRDFTGQETIAAVGLINMNGRVYDPVIARFLSPDPDVQSAGDLQNYNRYSYGLNNPLRYTDPTGYDWNSFWSDVGNGLKDFFSNPYNDLELLATVVACAAAPGVGCAVVGALLALQSATVALLEGGSFEQTAINFAIGIGVGAIASGIVNAYVPKGWIWSIIAGAESSAAATALTDVITGKSLGADVLESAVISAVQSAATYGLQQWVGPSQASAGDKKAPGGKKGSGSGGAGSGNSANSSNSGVGGALISAGKVALDIIGKIWALPDTAVALALALVDGIVSVASLPFGGQLISFQFANNSLQILHAPIIFSNRPFTLGNVEFWGTTTPDDFGDYGDPTVNKGLHEEAHTYQAEFLGPLFVPIWLLSGLGQIGNPLEAAGNNYARGGAWLPNGQ